MAAEQTAFAAVVAGLHIVAAWRMVAAGTPCLDGTDARDTEHIAGTVVGSPDPQSWSTDYKSAVVAVGAGFAAAVAGAAQCS